MRFKKEKSTISLENVEIIINNDHLVHDNIVVGTTMTKQLYTNSQYCRTILIIK